MKLKKIILLGCIAFVAVISINSTSPAPDGGDDGTGSGTRDFETDPPKPLAIWVQKLATVRSDGSNVMMRIQYEADSTLPATLSIHYSNGTVVAFHDDGDGADSAAGDFIYSAYLQENISAFTSGVSAMEANLVAQGSFIEFEGHNGHLETTIPHFDMSRFNAGQITPLSMHLIQGSDCGTDLLPQNSLFITDLSVVEDHARTYKMTSPVAGNADGVWTFGSMMRNMAAPASGVHTADFIKAWLKHWVADEPVNGQTVAGRAGIFGYVIQPWLHRARLDANQTPIPDVGLGNGGPPVVTLNAGNWEAAWDATDTTTLIHDAPFRLMAIVNRMDLRGNSGYTGGLSHAGETRFIFTLIHLTTGQVPTDPNGANVSEDFVDWNGMNVILEYGNTQTNPCDAKDFAQSWLDLSAFPLPTAGNTNTDYNSALEAITHTVIDASAAPSRPNHSALLRIRTDERVLYGGTCNQGAQSSCFESWEKSNWELRQFEINPTSHVPVEVPVANTPIALANTAGYNAYEALSTAGGALSIEGTTMPGSYFDPYTADPLMNWMFTSVVKQAILRQSHNIPALIPGSTDPLLAGSAIEYMDYTHFWNVDWQAQTAHYNASNYFFNTNSYPTERTMRHNLSVQTCQGCHTGETKTVFTQMRPLNYGVSARYWDDATPDYVHSVPNASATAGGLDYRFTTQDGTSYDPISQTAFPNYSQSDVAARAYFPKVSAFLTGRNYAGPDGAMTYEDDNFDPFFDNPRDQFMTGLFYVADPMNNTISAQTSYSYVMGDNLWGFNDLMMRQQSMCQFINLQCNPSEILQTIVDLRHVPLGHD